MIVVRRRFAYQWTSFYLNEWHSIPNRYDDVDVEASTSLGNRSHLDDKDCTRLRTRREGGRGCCRGKITGDAKIKKGNLEALS